MSLEKEIHDNTQAIRDLIAAMERHQNHLPAPHHKVAQPAVKEEEIVLPFVQEVKEEKKPEVTLEQAKTAFLDLIKSKGRDAGIAILTAFHAAKLPEVKPESYPEFMAAIAEASK